MATELLSTLWLGPAGAGMPLLLPTTALGWINYGHFSQPGSLELAWAPVPILRSVLLDSRVTFLHATPTPLVYHLVQGRRSHYLWRSCAVFLFLYSTGLPQTHYIAKDALDLLILLPLPPEFWGYHALFLMV